MLVKLHLQELNLNVSLPKSFLLQCQQVGMTKVFCCHFVTAFSGLGAFSAQIHQSSWHCVQVYTSLWSLSLGFSVAGLLG